MVGENMKTAPSKEAKKQHHPTRGPIRDWRAVRKRLYKKLRI